MQKDIFGYESMAELAKELAKRTGIKKEEAKSVFGNWTRARTA